jgi:hypothetical protein
MSFNLKATALILATVLVGGAVTVVNAQTGVPAGGGAAGGPLVALLILILERRLGKIIPEGPHPGRYIPDRRRNPAPIVRQ